MKLREIPRADLVTAVAARVRGGPPLLVTGPPGSGKSTLLAQVGRQLEAEGWAVVALDLFAAVASPTDLVESALGALAAERFAPLLPGAVETRRRLELGRAGDAAAVDGILRLWSSLDSAGGTPVLLVLDEIAEIRSLAYFAGLREAGRALAAALQRRARGTLLSTATPSGLGEAWQDVDRLAVPPVSASELSPVSASLGWRGEALVCLSGGWPGHVRALVESAEPGEDIEDVWVREMRRGGRLESRCRGIYETRLLRSRGYGMSKAVLRAVAHDEGLNLTAVVRKLGRTPGAVGDYLSWLVAVDALRRDRKRYYFADALVGEWVRLHGHGHEPGDETIRRAAQAHLAEADESAPATTRPAESAPEDDALATTPRRTRHDSLMEID